MLNMLGDKKKFISGIIATAKEKTPSKFSKDSFDGKVTSNDEYEEEDVTIKDQIMACASKVIKALNSSDTEGFAKAMFQMHEAIDEAIDTGVDFDEDKGQDESGEQLSDDSSEE